MKILILEDNQTEIESIQRQLSEHSVVVVTNFNVACRELRIAEEQSAKPTFDALITDIRHPKKGVRRACQTGSGSEQLINWESLGPILVLHAIGSGIPYVGLVSHADWPADEVESAANGMVSFCTNKSRFTHTTFSYLAVDKANWEVVHDPSLSPSRPFVFNKNCHLWVKNWRRIIAEIVCDPDAIVRI